MAYFLMSRWNALKALILYTVVSFGGVYTYVVCMWREGGIQNECPCSCGYIINGTHKYRGSQKSYSIKEMHGSH